MLIEEVWPGTRHVCDCIERAGDYRSYYLDMRCEKKGKSPAHSSEDCYDLEAYPPIT